MSFRPYPEYKDSGIEWLGDVPGHWLISPLLSIAEESKTSNKGMQDNNLLSLSYGRIVKRNIESVDGLLPESFETYQIVEPDDIVLRLTDLQNDQRSLRTGMVRERGIITSAYTALALRNVHPPYADYLLRTVDTSKVFYSFGGGVRQSMKYFDVKRIPIPSPPLGEQIEISTFLDRETAEIDAFIAEAERLIELLNERRTAAITQAVTKGLNPDAPMKDSGIEWLGEVPEHWEVRRLGSIGRAIIGLTYSPADVVESGTLVLRAGNIQNRRLVQTDSDVFLDTVVPEHLRLIRGDILICARNGSANLIGKNALVTKEHEGMSWGAFMAVFRSKINEYVSWILNSDIFTASIGSFSTSTINQITSSSLYSLMVPVPPEDERLQIVSYLENRTKQTDKAIITARKGIALARERRQALISAAVTGKIDVRSAL